MFLPAASSIQGAPRRHQNGSRRLKEASFNTSKIRFQMHTRSFQKELLKHTGWKLDVWRRYVAKSVFLLPPRSIPGAPRRLQHESNRLKDAWTQFKYGCKRIQDAFKRCCWSIYVERLVFATTNIMQPTYSFSPLQQASKVLQDAFKMFQDALRLLKYAFKREQAAFRKCCWSIIKVERLVFDGCMQPTYCFGHLQDASKVLQDALNLVQNGSETFWDA